MQRYLFEFIKADLHNKIILLSGPRQAGKTTLARSLVQDHEYLNWDNIDDRVTIIKKSWRRSASAVVLDELHKMPKWKLFLKGIWDGKTSKQAIIVTGSARLDTFRKVGDSLAGRFFPFRLHPFDVREFQQAQKNGPEKPPEPQTPLEQLQRILASSNFPEPYLEGSATFYNRWKKSHLDIILRQDLLDFESVHEINKVETLIALLASKVGSPISVQALANDLQASDKSVRRWITILESLFVVFKISPYSSKIARSLLKAQKIYFYDIGRITAGPGAKFENLVACALLKEIDRRQDCLGEEFQLHYLRDRNGQEIDFLISHNSKPKLAIEAKLSDTQPVSAFRTFCEQLSLKHALQVVAEPERERSFASGLDIISAKRYLSEVCF